MQMEQTSFIFSSCWLILTPSSHNFCWTYTIRINNSHELKTSYGLYRAINYYVDLQVENKAHSREMQKFCNIQLVAEDAEILHYMAFGGRCRNSALFDLPREMQKFCLIWLIAENAEILHYFAYRGKKQKFCITWLKARKMQKFCM